MANLWRNIKENIKHKRYSLCQYGTGIIFFVLLYIYTLLFDRPVCLLKNIFGISCVGCGMTRGFIAIFHFDFASAIQYNFLALPLFFGIGIHGTLLLVDILLGKSWLDKFEHSLSNKWMYILYGLLLVAGTLANNGIIF